MNAKKVGLFFLFLPFVVNAQQNLISNPSFEMYRGTCPSLPSIVGFSLSIDTVTWQNACVLKDWMNVYNSPDVYSKISLNPFSYPSNLYDKRVYPHSDSTFIGMGFLNFSNTPNRIEREMIEGKLIKPLVIKHHYQFSMYVQLFDTINAIDVGKIASCNSFSAYFSPNEISYSTATTCPFYSIVPQVQINQMVKDTQNWVQLKDTFMASGGEQYIVIGNFKTDANTNYEIVKIQDTLPATSYYFIDDVSLIDLDDTSHLSGIHPLANNKVQLTVYPNPCSSSLVISQSSLVNTVEVVDLIGRLKITTSSIPPSKGVRSQTPYLSEGMFEIDVRNIPAGIYFIKTTDDKGFVRTAKFVKE